MCIGTVLQFIVTRAGMQFKCVSSTFLLVLFGNRNCASR